MHGIPALGMTSRHEPARTLGPKAPRAPDTYHDRTLTNKQTTAFRAHQRLVRRRLLVLNLTYTCLMAEAFPSLAKPVMCRTDKPTFTQPQGAGLC